MKPLSSEQSLVLLWILVTAIVGVISLVIALQMGLID